MRTAPTIVCLTNPQVHRELVQHPQKNPSLSTLIIHILDQCKLTRERWVVIDGVLDQTRTGSKDCAFRICSHCCVCISDIIPYDLRTTPRSAFVSTEVFFQG